jgi:hypothetical protein
MRDEAAEEGRRALRVHCAAGRLLRKKSKPNPVYNEEENTSVIVEIFSKSIPKAGRRLDQHVSYEIWYVECLYLCE